MGKDGDASNTDSEAFSGSQSQRPTLGHHDSDSQVSDQAPHQNQQYQRSKSQKHIVGGGTGGRLHARVPSSKALHKHHASASSTKLSRRHTSPSPERGAGAGAGAGAASNHRRATSDLKLSRDSSSSNLKNSSQSAVKRNRSHVDVGKKNKSSTNLKRTLSSPTVAKAKLNGGSKVHFNIGDDDQDAQEDEWVDASTSASPLLSRRASVISGGQPANSPLANASPVEQEPTATEAESFAEQSSSLGTQGIDNATANHKQYITSRLLQRTPSHGAPPKMSTENVSVQPPSSRQHSPDSGLSRDTSSTLSGTSHTVGQVRPGSSGKEELTSRFVGNSSQGSGSTRTDVSFLTSANRTVAYRDTNGKVESNGPRRPRSMGNLEQAKGSTPHNSRGRQASANERNLTDDDDVDSGGLASGTRPRRRGPYAAPPEMNRTQQKLNLQRASSTLESAPSHPGMAIGLGGVEVTSSPMTGGPGYDSRNPRVTKLLERTGMEYLVVRRYQNPVARSIARLSQLPGANKNLPIPRPGTGHSKRGSDYAVGRPGLNHDLRDRDVYDPNGPALINNQASKRPTTPRRGLSYTRDARNQGTATNLENEALSRMHEGQGLSGSSLVDGEQDPGTMALLRIMWDKNLDLSASQD